MPLISNCCGAEDVSPFGDASYSDMKVCPDCKEHCVFECYEHNPVYQQPEPENNVQEAYYCDECGEGLPLLEQDIMLEAKEE
tara:strand:+ start:74 stop:319 length:246 start_codon:yes stop_codon:yes gene_type:complete